MGRATQGVRLITLKENDTLTVDIELDGSNRALDEVVVSAGKYEQKLSEVTVSMEVISMRCLLYIWQYGPFARS